MMFSEVALMCVDFVFCSLFSVSASRDILCFLSIVLFLACLQLVNAEKLILEINLFVLKLVFVLKHALVLF